MIQMQIKGFKRYLINPIIHELYALAEKQDGCGIRDKLKELVPDYTPQENECVL